MFDRKGNKAVRDRGTCQLGLWDIGNTGPKTFQ